MDAVISGRAGRALLWEQGPLWLLNLDEPRKLIPVRQPAVRLLFGNAVDLAFLENTDLRSVVQTLEDEHYQASALDLTLICLDSDLSRETRTAAIVALEEILDRPHVLARLENILYGRPLPETADLAATIEFCYSRHVSRVRNLFQRFSESQQGIREVRLAWDSIPIGAFGDSERQSEFEHAAIFEGLFRELAVARGSGLKVNEFRVAFLSNSLVQAMPNYREVLQEWVGPFLDQSDTKILIWDCSEEDDVDSYVNRGRKPTRRSFDRAAQFEKTNSQKEAITKAMRRQDHVRVRNLIDELIAHHMAWDGPRFAVKSLCDLAMEAKLLGTYSLQMELTKRCVKLQPNDAWSWAQYGDALLRTQRLSEALMAYERASELGKGAVAGNGRAEVLKELLRLDEALASYDEIVAEFPENLVARGGRAEVLKELGRLEQALDSYDAIIAEYPENVIARSGRAGVLRLLGRFDDALASYDAIIAEYPKNAVARGGRAEVLKELWRLDEALTSYDEIVAEFPEDVVARGGRAEVLRELGRLEQALDSYDTIIAEYPENVIARSGRAGVLSSLGRFDDARASYDAIIAEYPKNAVARGGRAKALKELGRLDEALDSYDAIIAEYPENVRARNGRARVLRPLGRFEDALASYDAIIAEYPKNAVARGGRAEVLKELWRLDEALASYDEIVEDYPQNVIASHGRSSVLLALHRYDEALESLPDDKLVTRSDWIGYHLRGMIWLHTGNIEGASRVFERGLEENPWKLDREYFRTALVVVKLKHRDFVGASEVLEAVTTPQLQSQANVLRLHSFGELGKDKLAVEAFNSLKITSQFISNEVVAELHRRYILKHEPRRDDEWVSKQEIELLPLLAGQYATVSQSYSYQPF